MTEEIEKRRDKYYIRVYSKDWLEDGISDYLTPSEQIGLLRLQLLSANQKVPGTLPLYHDRSDPYVELAHISRLKPSVLKSAIVKLRGRGWLIETQDSLIFSDWAKEQPQIQSRFPGKDWESVKAKKGVPVSDDPDKYTKGKYGHMVKR